MQSGIEDYNSAIRRALREASAEGIRVTYPSGHTRRLDTAVRQNVLDGIRKLNQANMEAIGERFGADGVEISAHMMCAEDHLPYQGKQYSNEEFARIQAALKRPFGEWNCRHSWNPIILGISRPAYTDEELRQFAQNSTEKITIGGKTKTRYEWTQEQRKVETAIRYQQDIATAAKASGDTELRRETRRNISALNNYYRKISEAANVPSRPERMGTYYGRTAGEGLKKNNSHEISIKIDELTPCLRKTSTGELVETTVTAISPTRKAFSTWLFNWTQPEKNGYTVYALKAKGDRKIQGLIAMKEEQGYIDVDLVEAAPHNNPQNKVYFSGQKEYNGVGGHLFAEACRKSFMAGFYGWIGFTAKTNLIEYYKKELGAIPLFEGSQRMEIRTDAALKLVEKYYGGKI